jgi:hypothetical protein
MTLIAPADLVGTWRLRAWQAQAPGGLVTRPFGEQPLGYVVYTADGRMITTISRQGREAIGGDVLAAPAARQAGAFGTFMAYSGTFRCDGGDVIHSVEMSLYPDWVGTEQRRHVELTQRGRQLTLSSQTTTSSGDLVRNRLHWERVED